MLRSDTTRNASRSSGCKVMVLPIYPNASYPFGSANFLPVTSLLQFANVSSPINDFFSSTWVIMFTVENLEVVGKHKEKNPIVILPLRNKPCYNFLQICFLFVCVLCACVIFLRYSQFFCSFFPLYFPFPSLSTSSR